MGALALQDERGRDAEALLSHSLASGGEARIYLRNLNNYLVLLKDTGREEDARALAAGNLPEWPEGVVPDAAGRRTVLSLVEALLVLGQPGKARGLLDRALPLRSSDAAALNLDGRLHLSAGNADRAVEILSRAVKLAPDDCQPLIALGYAQDRMGRRDACRETADRLARGWAVCSAPPKRSQRAAIMVLNPAPKSIGNLIRSPRGLHFSSNYAAEVAARMRDEYRFIIFLEITTISMS